MKQRHTVSIFGLNQNGCRSYYKFFCYYFSPLQSDVFSRGRSLLPNTRTWILFLKPQAHITLAVNILRSWSCVGNPTYSTTRIFSFTKRTKLDFDSVRLTQIDINFQQVVLQLRRRLGTTTDPVFLYPCPRSRQIEKIFFKIV